MPEIVLMSCRPVPPQILRSQYRESAFHRSRRHRCCECASSIPTQMIRPRDSIYVKIVNNRRWLYTMSATGSPANIGPRAIRVGFFVSGEDSKLLRFSRMRSGTRSVNRTDNLKFNAPRPKAQIDLAQSVHWFFNDYVDQWIGPKPYTFLRW